MKSHHQGLTLIEMMLAIAIGGTILVLGMQAYNVYSQQANVTQLQANVDTLFLAALNYYQINCGGTGTLTVPILSNTVSLGGVTIRPLSFSSDLTGYLPSSFPTPNPLVNSTSGNDYQGYLVQLNQSTKPVMQQVCTNPATCVATPVYQQIGTQVTWTIQVSVNINSTLSPAAYQDYLGADCLTSVSGGAAYPCSNPTSGTYVGFQRLPSAVLSSSSDQSTFWPSMPAAKGFLQKYTTNPITDLTGQSHTTEYQYFYCSS